MSAYHHGVYLNEIPTSIAPPVEVDSALPVVVGTAPVHNLPEGTIAPINEPRLIYTMAEFAAQFGGPSEDESAHDFTLYEFARVYIERYKVCPIVCINVFDPNRHCAGQDDPVPSAPDVSKVTSADIIGGTDSSTGKRTGLALADIIFPRFRLVPGQILAPGFSSEPEVAVAMDAVAAKISGFFRAVAIIDCPQSIARYTEAPDWLNSNNLTSANLLAFFGQAVYGNDIEHGSSHLAGIIGQRDAENESIPFWSPSNKRLLCNGLMHAGQPLELSPDEAAYLNGNGLVTGLNMVGGLVAWGDQTTCYPGVTDVKDSSIPVRRMMNFIGNTLILTAWEKVSSPLRRRLVETVCDMVNIWLNGLTAREFILGGRCEYLWDENPATDLMDGIARFHVYVTPPSAARELVFALEYDPSYLENLFGTSS